MARGAESQVPSRRQTGPRSAWPDGRAPGRAPRSLRTCARSLGGGAGASAAGQAAAHPICCNPGVAIPDAQRVFLADPAVARVAEISAAAVKADLDARGLSVVGGQAQRREHDSDQAAANQAEGLPARQVRGRVLGELVESISHWTVLLCG